MNSVRSETGDQPGPPTDAHRMRRWWPTAAAVGLLAMLLALAFRAVIVSSGAYLPGNDATNLYAWELFTRATLSSGTLPFWNPYHFAGTPHLADVQTTVFYPMALLLRWLPPVPFLTWMALLHVLFAGVGTYWCCRTVAVSWPAAVAAGTAIMLGGSIGGWLYNGHLLLIYTTAWLPWALALAIVSARRVSRLPHPGLVVVMVLQFLAGYLQGAVYITAVTAMYFLYVAWRSPGARWRPIVQLAVLGALATGLAAFQVLPTLQLVREAARTGGVPYDVAIQDAWRLRDLVRVFFPFSGIAVDPPHRLLADNTVYVGWLLAALVPFAYTSRSHRSIVLFLTGVAVGALAMALAVDLPFYEMHYALLPGFRVPGRLLFLVTLSLAVLGAIGADALAILLGRRAWASMATPLALSLGVLALAASAAEASAPSADPRVITGRWAPVAAVGGAAVLGGASLVGAVPVAGGAVLIATAIDLFAFTSGSEHPVSIEASDLVAQWVGPPDDGRVLSLCENRIGAGETLQVSQPNVDGMAGLNLADYADWADLARSDEAPAHDGLFHRLGSTGALPARRDLLDQANVTGFLACTPPDLDDVVLVSDAAPLSRYRNLRARPRATWSCGIAMLTRDGVIHALRTGEYEADGRLVPVTAVDVRWRSGLDARRRHEREAQYHLVEPYRLDGSTWRYRVSDASADNLAALIRDPEVDDTRGIDRGTGRLVAPDVPSDVGPGDEVLVTQDACRGPDVTTIVSNRPDGRLVVDVDTGNPGVVFISEPHYRERRAFVDGVEAPVLRANIAFSAVRVPAGRHRIELRYVPASFRAGAWTSGATLLVWGAVLAIGRRRARTSASVPQTI